MKARLTWIAVLAAVTIAASPAWSADGHVTFGSQWWTQNYNEAKYQEFVDRPKGAFLESFLMQDMQGPWALTLWGANADRKNQQYGLSLSNGVKYRFDFDYRGIPHLFSLTAKSLWTESAPGQFVLPDSLQRTNQEYSSAFGNTMTNALLGAGGTSLATQTEITRGRLRVRPAKGWQFDLTSSERRRTGRMAFGATQGVSAAYELPVPINQRTLDADATTTYSRGDVRLQGSVGLSQFTNDITKLSWDNPRRYTDATGTGGGPKTAQLALAPDNRVVRGLLSLGLILPHSSNLLASVSMADGKQDDPLMQFTSNSALAQSSLDSLPVRNADNHMVTITQDVRLSSRISSRMTGALRYHGENQDNQSAEIAFKGFSATDASWSATPVTTARHGGSRTLLGANVDFELMDGVNVGLVAENRHRELDDREFESNNENILGANLSVEKFDDLSFVLGYRLGDRKADGFDPGAYLYVNSTGGISTAELPGLRRFDLATRKQNALNSTLSYTFGPKFDISVDYTGRMDKFDETQYGLNKLDDHMVVGDGTYHMSKAVDMSGGYGFNQVDSRQMGRERVTRTGPADTAYTDWTANLRDRSVFVFYRGNWQAKKKLALTADYTFTRTLGTYGLSKTISKPWVVPGQDLPATLYRRHEVQLGATRKLMNDFDLTTRYGFDEFDVIDFAANNVPIVSGTLSSVTGIFLGENIHSYIAHSVALVIARRF